MRIVTPRALLSIALGTVFAQMAPHIVADDVVADDLIVQSSACIGTDCVDGELFGSDTIRLRENNLRIKFDDTSDDAGFPNNDWQITINDTANGGANKFSIDDTTNSKTPFTVEANAPSNSLYVDDNGRIGLGTSTPAVNVHLVEGNTPTLRLEQDGSSGFSAQTWDVAGNETSFFVRDVTNGSTLPFRIRNDAPNSAIDIDADGNVGFGDSSPEKRIDVLGSDDDATTDNDIAVQVNNTSGVAATRVLLNLENNGGVRFDMLDNSTANNWVFQNQLGTFDITLAGTGTREFRFYPNGNLELSGSLIQASSREIKNNILPVDQQSVLERVVALPINSWSYKKEQGVTHMGPIAEDFYQSFGLGSTPKGISSVDTGGVALAAIQGLYTQLQQKDSVISEQQSKIEDQQIRLAKLEAAVAELLAREDGFAAR